MPTDDIQFHLTSLNGNLVFPVTDENLMFPVTETLWIWENKRIIKKPIKYVPYLYKLFNDLLVGSAYGCNRIKVHIDTWNNKIIVWSDNILSNLFRDFIHYSIEFTIEYVEFDYGEPWRHTEVYMKLSSNEYSHSHKREAIKNRKTAVYWTRITFKPDLPIFGMECLDGDIVSLMKRRVFDVAGCSSVKVQLLGTYGLPKTFKDYVDIYLETCTHTTRIYEKVNDRWDICVAVADGHLKQFEQVSFVNNIATMKGGPHVDYITSQITDYLGEIVNLDPDDLKNYLWVFVNAHIDNPAFDSQTKEYLTTSEESFGSKYELSQEFLKKIADADVFKPFKSYAGELNIPKHQDAYLANTSSSKDCTLIVTIGDYAKDIAKYRLSEVGQNRYGVFSLEGELLNLREASPQELERNTDIQKIKKILGLEDGEIYKDVKKLRYGRLLIMADENHDGFQMKGLLINYLHYFWPSLLKVKSFLRMFIAPIVKASHKKTNQVCLFFALDGYNTWLEKEKSIKDYNIKIYQALKDIKKLEDRGEYCFEHHIKDFVWVDDKDDFAIELAFSNKKIEEKKRWLLEPEDVTNFDPLDKCIRYLDFINQEFKQYAMADIQRSIPSIVDGLNPCQRKILFYAFKKPISEEIKADDFSVYVFEQSAYRQSGDEASIVENYVVTITGMAQNYVGSNNINLLQSNGQFGTRVMGGEDHRSDTYLFINLSPITQCIFHEDDELLLNYLNEGDQSIEPVWFIPIIPMVLVNGCESRGVWSSFIPNYNPRDVIANLKRLLEGKEMIPMVPWYKGFGYIKASKDGTYITKGKIRKEDKNASTKDCKKFLRAASQGGTEKDIKAYTDCSDDTSVPFEITMTKDQMNRAREAEEDDMHLFDKNGELKKYDTPQKILEEFFQLRLEFYEKRKTNLLWELKKASMVAENKLRFIKQVVNGKLLLGLDTKDLKCEMLEFKGFQSLPAIAREAAKYVGMEETRKEEEEEEEKPGTKYDYLLYIVWQLLGPDYLEKLEEEINAKEKKMCYIKDNSSKSLWLKDLEALDEKLGVEYPLARDDASRESANKKKRRLA